MLTIQALSSAPAAWALAMHRVTDIQIWAKLCLWWTDMSDESALSLWFWRLFSLPSVPLGQHHRIWSQGGWRAQCPCDILASMLSPVCDVHWGTAAALWSVIQSFDWYFTFVLDVRQSWCRDMAISDAIWVWRGQSRLGRQREASFLTRKHNVPSKNLQLLHVGDNLNGLPSERGAKWYRRLIDEHAYQGATQNQADSAGGRGIGKAVSSSSKW